jgi:hypothetical protein
MAREGNLGTRGLWGRSASKLPSPCSEIEHPKQGQQDKLDSHCAGAGSVIHIAAKAQAGSNRHCCGYTVFVPPQAGQADEDPGRVCSASDVTPLSASTALPSHDSQQEDGRVPPHRPAQPV